MQTTIYDPKKVTVTVANQVVTGFSDDGIITIARNSDSITPYIGVRGEHAYSINHDNTGTITVSLQQGSPWEAKFQTLKNNRSVFNINIVDSNGRGNGFTGGGTEAIIMQEPELVRAGEVQTSTWSIYVFDLTLVRKYTDTQAESLA